MIDEGVSTIDVHFDDQDKAIDFKVLDVNPAHEVMTGLGRDVIGKRGREVIPGLEQSVIERLGQVALTGQPIRFEEFFSGLGRWFDIYLARDGGSDSRRVISVSSNITERKRREHHAYLSRSRWRAVSTSVWASSVLSVPRCRTKMSLISALLRCMAGVTMW